MPASPDAPPGAMLLAAGFGTRLRPLTLELPKPLVPVATRPLAEYGLRLLERAGARRVVVNLHHLGEQLPAALGARLGGLELVYSPEQELLGTGGGLVRARGELGGGTVLVVNGDVLCAAELGVLLAAHRARGAAASLLVRPLPAGSGFTPLAVDGAGRLRGLGDWRPGRARAARGATRPMMFCGLYAFEPALFDFLPAAGPACVVEQGFKPMLEAGLEIAAVEERGPWFDLGTPRAYLEANLELLSGRLRLGQLDALAEAVARGATLSPPGVLVEAGAELGAGVRLGPLVAVGRGARVGAGAALSRAVVWPGAEVPPGARLDGVVVHRGGVLRALPA
ncbi:MAG TPA: NDP-sugar synthase [Myxococcota bacterium]|nr:NDP-sugar synthase [Myxococcota bacterium]HRY93456.1 NDP-sugar synthase [Myxococcota bacterium]HSA20303.1 NDP-sugar synthase [Myxococcota bacterium]